MKKTGKKEFLIGLYRYMFLMRSCEERLGELYQQGLVKGTVALGTGNEAAIVGLVSALNEDMDVINLMQRDFAGYLIRNVPISHLFNHYLANKESSSGGKDGNVHHGVIEKYLLPMVSHLGSMLPAVVGAVYAQNQKGIPAIGAAIVGDGTTSIGDFHEALNMASVLNIPVIFFIENNHYAYSTPNKFQFNCKKLSHRAYGYGIKGKTIKGTNVLSVYNAVKKIANKIRKVPQPFILEVSTLRLKGHAVYDNAEYVPETLLKQWCKDDPVAKFRRYLLAKKIMNVRELNNLEQTCKEDVAKESNQAIKVEKVNPKNTSWAVYKKTISKKLEPVHYKDITAIQALNKAMEFLLEKDQNVFLLGEDIGVYGGPFKATKDLYKKFGRSRVIDMPIGESGMTGFGVGSAQMGMRPIVEMQFADFSTNAVTQLCIHAATSFFRSRVSIPLTVRLAGGGGLSFGPFHSEELEGLFNTFPGLKIVYPSRINDYYRFLLASVYDENPVLFFENKYLYRRITGDITFDGNIDILGKADVYKEGSDLTLVTYGAMFHESLSAVDIAEKESGASIEIIDLLTLKPLDLETICASVKKTKRLLVVHEAWACGGIGSEIIAGVVNNSFFDLDAPPLKCTAPDTPVPFAPELEAVFRPNCESIINKINEVLEY
ncbi:MAG: thiamine pyrophosphate-dependent enzyme [bacterium]